ncbi:MAG: molybdopterin-dependent oxidoreductase [Salinisphaera sp.]|nr:molybdopterin-dependent oxidoreductase [Salinisphaera sp.]
MIDSYHHDHFPSLYRTPSSFMQQNKVDETRLPVEDNTIYYGGQFVALVVADTFENARNAAYYVDVKYTPSKAVSSLEQGLKHARAKPARSAKSVRGDPDSAFESAAHQFEATYATPVETHNPIEMHATTAHWNNGQLTFYEASQGVIFARNTMAAVFGISPDRVEVRAPYIGSGFGSKLWIWPHAVCAAAASRELARPVQLVVPRHQMFTTACHRPQTRQNIRLATDADGRFVSISHDSINTTSFVNTYVENCRSCTKSLYNCDKLRVTQSTIQVNQGTPTSMRGPGATPGLFALESAVDEMTEKLNMDPVELNYTDQDASKNLPFSSIHLLEAYDKGAETFGRTNIPSARSVRISSRSAGTRLYRVCACIAW